MKSNVHFFVVRERDRIDLSWYVNTNEDVGNFRLELRSGDNFINIIPVPFLYKILNIFVKNLICY